MTYSEFRERCRQRPLPEGVYTERHHIIPKCKGGRMTKANIIVLTGQEHYEAHRLLALENPEDRQLQYAWLMMACGPSAGNKRESYYTKEDYERLRQIAVEHNKSEERRQKMKGRPSSMKGKHHSEETKRLLSAKLKGRPQQGHHGHPCSERAKQILREKFTGRNNWWTKKGRVVSDETKEKLRQRALNQETMRRHSVICVETGKQYRSQMDAAKDVNCKVQHVWRAVKYPTRTAGGYHWISATCNTEAE